MRLCAPSYYPSFSCIADRCAHSCCVGWQIAVDAETVARYRALPTEEAEAILSTVTATLNGGANTFRLEAGGRCPHLTARGLCHIIDRYGDGLLCDICREHPRFYHVTARGMEVGLGASCEEACRRILTSDGYDRFIDLGEHLGDGASLPSFDAVAVRERLYAILSDRTVPYPARLQCLWSYADMSAPPSTEDARELLASLEYLQEEHKAHLLSYTDTASVERDCEMYLERFLSYLIFRHVSPVTEEGELISALRLCFFLERQLASLIAGGEDVFEAARMLSEELEYSEDNTEAILFACPFF